MTDWLGRVTCNVNDCLRRYKNTHGEVQYWCDLTGENLKEVIPYTKRCPFYCNKFFCQLTRSVITTPDETDWISTVPMKDDVKKLYRIYSEKDVKFMGLSGKGRAKLFAD